MNVRGAIDETYQLARQIAQKAAHRPALFAGTSMFYHDSLGYDHLCEMYISIRRADVEKPMSVGKLNRWLAWMQASIVSWNEDADLETMKEINKRHI